MGRPTNEKKGKTLKIRVSDELYEEIGRYGSNISESVRELIKVGIEKHGKTPKGDNVPQNHQNELETALLGRCEGEAVELLKRQEWNCITVISSKEYEKITQNSGNVPQNIIEEDTLKDLEQMCRLSGLTTTRFFEHIRRLFNDGYIYVDGMVIRTRSEQDLSGLVDICHRMNVDPQDMIDKLVVNLRRQA